MPKGQKQRNPKPAAAHAPRVSRMQWKHKPTGAVCTITALAVMCGVSEVTIRRWVATGRIPAPQRFMYSLYWECDVATAIARSGPGPASTYRPGPAVKRAALAGVEQPEQPARRKGKDGAK